MQGRVRLFKLIILLGLGCFPSIAWSAPLTDGGVISHSELKVQKNILPNLNISLDRPLPQPQQDQDDSPKVLINKIEFTGNQVFSDEKLTGIIEDSLLKKHSFTGLKNIATLITREYRKEGYLMATAFVPAQDISTNVLNITILEGLLGNISIDSTIRSKPERVTKYFKALQDTPLISSQIERKLRLLNDNGVRIQATFSPGEALGTTDLNIQTSQLPLIQAQLSVDNEGNRYTNTVRSAALIQINDPFGYTGRHSFSFVTGGSGYQHIGLDSDLPIGYDGLTFNFGLNSTQYQLGKEFTLLDAKGDSHRLTIGLSYPWVRSLNKNLYTDIRFEDTEYEDSSLSISTSERSIKTLSASIYGDVSEPGKVSNWRVSTTIGKTKDSVQPSLTDEFQKISIMLGQNKLLTQNLRLQSRINGQYSAQNLASAQKMALGGADAVRAYSQGEGLVDVGLLAKLELHYQLKPSLSLSSFIDAGFGKLKRNPSDLDTDNRIKLSGIGVAASYSNKYLGEINLSAAWRVTGKPASSPDKSPRVWLQWVKPIN